MEENTKKETLPTPLRKDDDTEDKIKLPGYPLYSPEEDIYAKGQLEDNIDPENIFEMKEKTEKDKAGTGNEKGVEEGPLGKDLDIPGSELDDPQEEIGSEDEENNYYSLGGDNHNELEEDKGE
jgi:hypothetical protein